MREATQEELKGIEQYIDSTAEFCKVEDCKPNVGDHNIPIHNAIIIPEDATNGDVIKIMFPLS